MKKNRHLNCNNESFSKLKKKNHVIILKFFFIYKIIKDTVYFFF